MPGSSSIFRRSPSAGRTRNRERKPKPFVWEVSFEKCSGEAGYLVDAEAGQVKFILPAPHKGNNVLAACDDC
jgi:hypothetical protein